jgi:fibronectin-binding autotransporter adhesin
MRSFYEQHQKTIRGGRMTKFKGNVASFAPALMSGAAVITLSASGALAQGSDETLSVNSDLSYGISIKEDITDFDSGEDFAFATGIEIRGDVTETGGIEIPIGTGEDNTATVSAKALASGTALATGVLVGEDFFGSLANEGGINAFADGGARTVAIGIAIGSEDGFSPTPTAFRIHDEDGGFGTVLPETFGNSILGEDASIVNGVAGSATSLDDALAFAEDGGPVPNGIILATAVNETGFSFGDTYAAGIAVRGNVGSSSFSISRSPSQFGEDFGASIVNNGVIVATVNGEDVAGAAGIAVSGSVHRTGSISNAGDVLALSADLNGLSSSGPSSGPSALFGPFGYGGGVSSSGTVLITGVEVGDQLNGSFTNSGGTVDADAPRIGILSLSGGPFLGDEPASTTAGLDGIAALAIGSAQTLVATGLHIADGSSYFGASSSPQSNFRGVPFGSAGSISNMGAIRAHAINGASEDGFTSGLAVGAGINVEGRFTGELSNSGLVVATANNVDSSFGSSAAVGVAVGQVDSFGEVINTGTIVAAAGEMNLLSNPGGNKNTASAYGLSIGNEQIGGFREIGISSMGPQISDNGLQSGSVENTGLIVARSISGEDAYSVGLEVYGGTGEGSEISLSGSGDAGIEANAYSFGEDAFFGPEDSIGRRFDGSAIATGVSIYGDAEGTFLNDGAITSKAAGLGFVEGTGIYIGGSVGGEGLILKAVGEVDFIRESEDANNFVLGANSNVSASASDRLSFDEAFGIPSESTGESSSIDFGTRQAEYFATGVYIEAGVARNNTLSNAGTINAVSSASNVSSGNIEAAGIYIAGDYGSAIGWPQLGTSLIGVEGTVLNTGSINARAEALGGMFLPQGKALNIAESGPFEGFDGNLVVAAIGLGMGAPVVGEVTNGPGASITASADLESFGSSLLSDVAVAYAMTLSGGVQGGASVNNSGMIAANAGLTNEGELVEAYNDGDGPTLLNARAVGVSNYDISGEDAYSGLGDSIRGSINNASGATILAEAAAEDAAQAYGIWFSRLGEDGSSAGTITNDGDIIVAAEVMQTYQFSFDGQVGAHAHGIHVDSVDGDKDGESGSIANTGSIVATALANDNKDSGEDMSVHAVGIRAGNVAEGASITNTGDIFATAIGENLGESGTMAQAIWITRLEGTLTNSGTLSAAVNGLDDLGYALRVSGGTGDVVLHTKGELNGLLVIDEGHDEDLRGVVEEFGVSELINGVNVYQGVATADYLDRDALTLEVIADGQQSIYWDFAGSDLDGNYVITPKQGGLDVQQVNAVQSGEDDLYDAPIFSAVDPTGVSSSANALALVAQAGMSGLIQNITGSLSTGDFVKATRELPMDETSSGASGMEMFVRGEGSSYTFEGNGTTVLAQDIDATSLAIGGVTDLGNGLKLGLMGGTTSYDLTASGVSGRSYETDASGYFFGTYVGAKIGGARVIGGLSFGSISGDQTRFVNAGGGIIENTAEVDSSYISPEIQIEADFQTGRGLTITPMARLRHSMQSVEGYTETSPNPGSAATVSAYDVTATDVEAGIAVSQAIGNGTLTGRVGVLNRTTGGDSSVPFSFGSGGAQFVGIDSQEFTIATFGVDYAHYISDAVSFEIGAEGFSGGNDVSGYSLTATLDFRF